ncbi:MAG: hypothetical protein M1821_008678 [Bathelium mastoideum]|nr:MAG: hypothetical protein M1821_008678 [Bathelium mastoideum]
MVTQILYEKVTEAANDFPDGPLRQRYSQAAASFRIPYWDWAVVPPDGGPTLPISVTSPTVNVTVPSGDNSTTTTIQISNPLYSYVFHPLVPSDFEYSPDYAQFTLYPETLRSPSTMDASAVSNDDYVASIIDGARSNLQDRLYNLLTSSEDYTFFSTEMWSDEDKTLGLDSLESVHDVIHNNIGVSGHMNYIVFSAFDPVFWLHHVMIDRLFAIWQVINPDSYIEPAAQWAPTFTYAINATEDGNSHSTGDFWTSFDVSNVSTFNYNYPELWNDNNNAPASVGDVQASINMLYGSSGAGASVSSRSAHLTKAKEENANTSFAPDEALVTDASTPTGAFREYIATIQAQKNGLGDSFSVYIFIGPFEDDVSSQSRLEPGLVGTQGFFANPGPMSSNFPLISSGTVPLTTTLANKVASGELQGLGLSEVSAYLKRNLRWRIMKADGCVVSTDEVPGLQICVVSADMEPAMTPSKFPIWGPFVSHPEITQGMAGGMCP